MRTRRIFALLAAYVVALQALLLPLSVATANPFQANLCSEASNGSPVRHDTGCPCAAGCGMQCHMPALAGPPQLVVADQPARGIVVRMAPARESVIRIASHNPHSPRAPPAA